VSSAIAEAVTPAAPARRRWLRYPLPLVAGGVIAGLVVAVALAADLVVRFPYDEFHYDDVLKPPSATYVFGTDMYGRDVFSRVVMGTRISLAYGLGCAGLGLLVGVPLGLWAGYRGGWIDEAVMRGLDVFMSIPPLMLGLLVLAMTVPALWKAILAIGLLSAPAIARIVRSVTLSLRHEEFVQAARARGESDLFVVFSEILPNAAPSVIVEAGLQFTFGILLGAALSFLGLGAQPPSSDWGLMISEARELVTVAPWISLFPALAMFVTVIGFNLVGDGLHEITDPRRGRR
jgi:peptide/nickel transport system permease protein